MLQVVIDDMRATIPFIRDRFERFNAQMFGGELPWLPIGLSRARTFVGVCSFKRRRLLGGGVEHYDFKLRISERFDLSESELEDTIIHEMIHYYIGVHQWRDTSAHGRLFRRLMDDINERFGRAVSVSHRSTKGQREGLVDGGARYRVVAVVRFRDGRVGIKVLPRKSQRILYYYCQVGGHRDVAHVALYMTHDAFFNRFPNSSSLKVHFVSEEELRLPLKGAKVIGVEGNMLSM